MIRKILYNPFYRGTLIAFFIFAVPILLSAVFYNEAGSYQPAFNISFGLIFLSSMFIWPVIINHLCIITNRKNNIRGALTLAFWFVIFLIFNLFSKSLYPIFNTAKGLENFGGIAFIYFTIVFFAILSLFMKIPRIWNYDSLLKNYKSKYYDGMLIGDIYSSLGFFKLTNKSRIDMLNTARKEKYEFFKKDDKLIRRVNEKIFLIISADQLDHRFFPISRGTTKTKFPVHNIIENVNSSFYPLKEFTVEINQSEFVDFNVFLISSEDIKKKLKGIGNVTGLVNFGYVWDKEKFSQDKPNKFQIETMLKKESIHTEIPKFFIKKELIHNFRGKIINASEFSNPLTKQELYLIRCEVDKIPMELAVNKINIMGTPSKGDIFEASVNFVSFDVN